MNLKEYKKYVNEECVILYFYINNNIENLLKDNEEELSFYYSLVNASNRVCEKRNNLEQALDEIEKILRQPQFEYDNIPCNYEDDIEKIKGIIQKAKGDDK
jgi:hypothetical protein